MGHGGHFGFTLTLRAVNIWRAWVGTSFTHCTITGTQFVEVMVLLRDSLLWDKSISIELNSEQSHCDVTHWFAEYLVVGFLF